MIQPNPFQELKLPAFYREGLFGAKFGIEWVGILIKKDDLATRMFVAIGDNRALFIVKRNYL